MSLIVRGNALGADVAKTITGCWTEELKVEDTEPKTNGIAITGLILGILCFFAAPMGIELIPILAVCLSVVGLILSFSNGYSGLVPAIIGLVLGILGMSMSMNAY